MFTEIEEWVTHNCDTLEFPISKVKLGIKLLALTAHDSKKKKVNGKTTTIRQGIKVRTVEMDSENDESED